MIISTKGATLLATSLAAAIRDFNPRTPRGVRQFRMANFTLFKEFQSTHPRRVRQIIDGDSSAAAYISIHAPARGATRRTATTL